MGSKLLIVDDDRSIRTLLDDYFSDEGFQVSTAVDGCQALRNVGESLPDMILMDLNMPVLDGVAAIRALKTDPNTCGIPVYAMSAAPLIRAWADELLADHTVPKPFDLPGLLEEIVERLRSA